MDLEVREVGPLKNGAADADHAGRTSSIGMIGVVAREDIPERTARARTAAAVRVFICIWTLERARSDGLPERPPESVIESNRLQVKNKAVIVSGPCATCLPSATLAVPGRRPIGGASSAEGADR
jgi:hypothetical protein